MSSRMVSRLSSFAWMLAGLLYIGQALVSLVKPHAEVFTSASDYAIEVCFGAALLLTLVALLGIRKEAGTGMFPTVSFFVFFIGTLLLFVSAAASLASGRDVLDFVYLLGLGSSLLGTILLAIAIIRAKTLPLWSAIALMLGLLISVGLGDTYGGGIVLGLTWITVGVALLTKLNAKAKAAAPLSDKGMPSS